MAVNPDVVFDLVLSLYTLTQTLVVSYLDDYVTKALGLVGDTVSPSLIVWLYSHL